MLLKYKVKEIVFWLIFLATAFLAGFWIVNTTRQIDIEQNDFIYTKTIIEKDPYTLDGLIIKIPENESITVKLQKRKLSNATERYLGEFNESNIDKEFPLRGSVVLFDDIKIDSDDDHLVMPMSVDFGGSGEFVYLGLFKKEVGGLVHVNSLFVGDRISPLSLDKDIDSMVFKYKSLHVSQSMSEDPFVNTELNFINEGDLLIEEEKYFNTNSDIYIEPQEMYPNKIVSQNISFVFMAKSWLFEDTSGASLFSENYEPIDNSIASSVDGNWMIADYVPIKVVLNAGEYKGRAKIILNADNSSGIPSRDKKMEFWVYIK